MLLNRRILPQFLGLSGILVYGGAILFLHGGIFRWNISICRYLLQFSLAFKNIHLPKEIVFGDKLCENSTF